MSGYSNYHIHSSFCDGKDTPEELLLEALAQGCPEIGFSGHCYTDFSPNWCMSPEGTEAYRREVLRLKEKYAGQIRVYLGVEQDLYASQEAQGYDYIIGAVHFIRKNGRYYTIDESREEQLHAVKEAFGGDYYAYAEAYYEAVGQVYETTGCQIVAHFDLISKFNEEGSVFDEAHPRYRAAVEKVLDRLQEAPVAFEMNTGAIARGYRKTPYPAPWILQELKRRDLPVILSGDTHDRRQLLLDFARCEALARSYGLRLLSSVSEIK